MPLVRIDVIEGRTPEELPTLADCVQQALVEALAALSAGALLPEDV